MLRRAEIIIRDGSPWFITIVILSIHECTVWEAYGAYVFSYILCLSTKFANRLISISFSHHLILQADPVNRQEVEAALSKRSLPTYCQREEKIFRTVILKHQVSHHITTTTTPAMGTQLPFFWASRPCGHAGWLAMLLIKAGNVETNPGPTTTRKQVWICDIYHRHIQVRTQISIRYNMIEHWVHLRCAGIRLAQYTDTWTCHQHR